MKTQTTTPRLTDKEKVTITAIGNSCYGEGPGSHIWSWDVCGDKSKASVLGSLMRKGFVGGQGSGDDATCWLTKSGMAAFYQINPDSDQLAWIA
jgi:hypothetical protein